MKKSKKDLTVQEAGRIGGYIRRQTADYSEMGKKGMASRWSTVRAEKAKRAETERLEQEEKSQ